jgi:CheY-like chemotaxis protein
MLDAIGSAPRVLVVDDNPDIAAVFGDLLTLHGFRVLLASNGAGALASLANFKPEAILLDIGLPDMTGYEMAMRVRCEAGYRNIPIVAISGSKRDNLKGERTGITHHLVKPVNFEQLTAVLGELLSSDIDHSAAV